ncbi:MAG: asparagine synthase (glutamine-hydrolyzing) [Deltaproteobacteria bacterium]|nr:asparagine synthase (glutamine-hydrolyzing) [Deltaproteobacteria bacterium]
MCGIAGVLFHRDDEGAPRRGHPAPSFTRVLRDRLAHRGPDGDGVYVDDGTALVHTRLALIDPAGGAQPLQTPDGRFVVVVNGEIYNHAALRSSLAARGAVFRTRSDAEVLLWTLALRDVDGLDELEGEYAFCCWDTVRRRAILGRDPLGVKPLVVAAQAGAWWFASEVKALLAVLPAPELRPDVVVEAIVSPALSGEAIPWIGIENVPAGAVVVVDRSGSRIVKRAQRRPIALPTPELLADALQSAVRDRMVADAPIGAFLSGGVDSSAIVKAALSSSSSSPLPCFSIRFEAHHAAIAGSIVVGDDVPYSELLARAWPIELVRVRADRQSLVDDIDALGASQDRLAAWEQELTQRALARRASSSVKAVLVGDAADETHFGYAFALAPEVCASPMGLMERFGFSRRRRLLRPGLQTIADGLEGFYRDIARTPFGDDVGANRRAMTTLLQARWLPRLLHNGDLHTMAFGLEARVPFSDRRVLDIAAAVPLELGFVDGDDVPEKSFLRRAVAGWLPPSITARRKSALPRDDGLGPLFRDRLRLRLLDHGTRERLAGFLDLDALNRLIDPADDVDAVDEDTGRAILFSILALDAFLRHA